MRSISITRILAMYAKIHDCVFTVNGQVEQPVLLFSPEVYLPVVALHADMMAQSALDRPLGIEFVQDDQSLLGVTVNVQPLTGDEISVLRAAFFTRAMHQIFGLSKDSQQIECAPVFEAYENGLMSFIEKNGGMQWPVAIVSHR